MIHVDGVWRPINGSGGNSNSSSSNSSEGTVWPVDPDAPMLTADNFFSVFESKALELDINPSTLTEEQVSQLVSSMNSVKFATPKQGNAVLIDYDLDNGIFTFQCDDGSIITFTSDHGDTFITGLRPGIDGYIIWKTTIDKLPVRESQEEPNPGGGSPKSVKSGPSLKGGGGGGTEEVYTVINNNTGEIVDPLELHKLTNVIWYDYFGMYYPFYLNGVEDFNLHKDGIYNNDDYISSWACMPCFSVYFTYLTVLLYYDYTLKPRNSVRIQTTNNYTITDIDTFFN